jgi:putative membrane protein
VAVDIYSEIGGPALVTKDASTPERTLVLCVDRDDDLGAKAGVKTPIVGREENIAAAVSLALKDPEEPDANAIFEAVRIYDRFHESAPEKEEIHGECQIATIAGSELGDVGADKTLVTELTDVLKAFPATEVILVSDGFADEAILPLVQSRVPVTSVRRITVKHSESIEETVWVFSRYLKMLFENAKYARIVLGLPGILLIILGVMYALNWINYIWIAFLVVLGTAFIIKGFMLDKAARTLYVWIREYSPPPFPVQIASYAMVAGLLLFAIGLYQGGFEASTFLGSQTNYPRLPQQWLAIMPALIGRFVSQSIALIAIGICVMLSGRAIRWFFERDSRLLRTVGIVVTVAWSWQIFYQASQILITPSLTFDTLVYAIVIGILLGVASVLVTMILHRKYAAFFREKETKIEEG